MVIEFALGCLQRAMRHGPVERIRTRQLFHARKKRALHARSRIENILHQAKRLNRLAENIDLHATLEHHDRHIRVQLANNGERLIVCLQDFLIRLERGNRLTRALEQHHFVKLALDNGMNLVAVLAR